jgi:hypothetical protein
MAAPEYKRQFPTLTACVEYLRARYPRTSLVGSRDIDTGEMEPRARFPRWLFRGEPECFPSSTSALVRLRASSPAWSDEVEMVADFVHRHVVHQLVLPYLSEVETITNLQWLGVAATYEGLAFCQHYGLPTALIDFTSSLRVAAGFAVATAHRPAARPWGRIAVLDVMRSRSCSQIWDFRDLSPTRAARQRAYGLYVAGHADLCAADVRRRLGLVWYRFRRDPSDERPWLRGFDRLLATTDDRLAGWVRHGIAMHVREHGALDSETAAFLASRVPMVPLLARITSRGRGSFVEPTAVPFDPLREHRRSLRDWTRLRAEQRGASTRLFRRISSSLVRYVGT